MAEYDTAKTSEKIWTFVDTKLKLYGISELMCKNAVVVSDGASNMVRAFEAFDKSDTMKKYVMLFFRLIAD